MRRAAPFLAVAFLGAAVFFLAVGQVLSAAMEVASSACWVIIAVGHRRSRRRGVTS